MIIASFVVGVAVGAACRNSIFKALDSVVATAKELIDRAKKTDI